jgi:hypothetical protein
VRLRGCAARRDETPHAPAVAPLARAGASLEWRDDDAGQGMTALHIVVRYSRLSGPA